MHAQPAGSRPMGQEISCSEGRIRSVRRLRAIVEHRKEREPAMRSLRRLELGIIAEYSQIVDRAN